MLQIYFAAFPWPPARGHLHLSMWNENIISSSLHMRWKRMGLGDSFGFLQDTSIHGYLLTTEA
jgi:hypothetical protein